MDRVAVRALSLRDLAPDTLPTSIVVAPDRGCSLARSCLACPFDRCVEDLEGWAKRRFIEACAGRNSDDRRVGGM